MILKNITARIEDAEGRVETVEDVISRDFTADTQELSTMIARLYRPNELGYTKIYLAVKQGDKVLYSNVRFDLARDEYTPTTVVSDLVQLDESLEA